MKRQCIPVRASFCHFSVLFVLLGAGLAGCQFDDPAIASDLNLDDPAIASDLNHQEAAALAAGCVGYRGFENCALGAATLLPSQDGATLEVRSMQMPDKDGVAILLPDTTEFEFAGTRQLGSTPTLITKAISAGTITSTMRVRNTADGFIVSSNFTGNQSSTYHANLYRAGALVRTITGLRSGLDGLQARWAPSALTIHIRIRIGFKVISIDITIDSNSAEQIAASEGACVWDLPLEGQAAVATLADGTQVTFDRVQLVEDVQEGGSYPYLTFDRIDYTSNDGTFRIDDEHTN